MNLDDFLHSLSNVYYRSPKYIANPIGFLYRKVPDIFKYGKSYSYFRGLLTNGTKDNLDGLVNQFFLESIESASKIPFYQNYYANHGVSFSQIKDLRDIKRLPIIRKSSLKENLASFLQPDKDNLKLYMTTGGSTGVPVGFYLHRGVTRAKELAFFDNAWGGFGYSKSSKILTIRGLKFEGGYTRFDPIKNSLLLSSYSLTEDNIAKIVSDVNQFQPEFIHAYPSSLYFLARLMRRSGHRFDFPINAAFCGSENLYKEHIDYIERFFKTKIFGWYGHAERLVLGYRDCSTGLYSFDPLYGYAEVSSSGSNSPGSIIATGFHNDVMPLIRYDTGDLAQSWKMSDGLSLEVGAIEGRIHEFVYSFDLRPVSMTAINMHDDIFDRIDRFQFSQDKAGVVDFLYETSTDNQFVDENKIKRKLLDKLGGGFSLDIKRVKNIKLSPSGKQSFLLNSINSE